jgi:hypothetical protein
LDPVVWLRSHWRQADTDLLRVILHIRPARPLKIDVFERSGEAVKTTRRFELPGYAETSHVPACVTISSPITVDDP